jgi:hypothetical protein
VNFRIFAVEQAVWNWTLECCGTSQHVMEDMYMLANVVSARKIHSVEAMGTSRPMNGGLSAS